MKSRTRHKILMPCILVVLLIVLIPAGATAKIDGITGPTFNLTVKQDYVSTAEGGVIYIWGYANGAARAQYPGPVLIVNQGDTVTVNLTNQLPATGPTAGIPVSAVFPGHKVAASGGTPGLLTNEATPGQTVSYTFTATNPGTYEYHSGTNPALQVEMGLAGVIIVRPAGFNPAAPLAYNHPATAYKYEYLYIQTEMDPYIHQIVEFFGVSSLAGQGYLTEYFPYYWFLNGRVAPDTLAEANVSWLPTQPMNALTRTTPGEKILMRVVSLGRNPHPFHHHGNHARIIARDGRLLESAPGAGPDIGQEGFTITAVPGETVDALFEWTGKGMGWDVYGHAPGDPLQPNEDPADHGKPFPVILPNTLDTVIGPFYSGSPFLGAAGPLPPGEGGLNPNAGFAFMWHSHTEKELTNFNIFPGGLFTMILVEPPGTVIPQ